MLIFIFFPYFKPLFILLNNNLLKNVSYLMALISYYDFFKKY